MKKSLFRNTSKCSFKFMPRLNKLSMKCTILILTNRYKEIFFLKKRKKRDTQNRFYCPYFTIFNLLLNGPLSIRSGLTNNLSFILTLLKLQSRINFIFLWEIPFLHPCGRIRLRLSHRYFCLFFLKLKIMIS